MIRKGMGIAVRVAGFVIASFLLVAVTLIVARAMALRDGPGLEWWHTAVITSEFREQDRETITNLDQYLENEAAVFDELRAMEAINAGGGNELRLNRFRQDSPSYPVKSGHNLNRSAVMRPSNVRGGVLLLHGMTDSPYSLQHLASMFYQKGYYVLNMRMPGHGTIPAELDRIQWQDWDQAVRLGAKHVAGQIEAGQPFYLLGYSNGASLALKYSMDSIDDAGLRTPDHVFLLSPMIGVDPLARFSALFNWLGRIEYFRQSRWLETYPEYDPHKYNSFPMNAALQSYRLTTKVKEQLQRMAKNGGLRQMPPIMTFQSLVDKTVATSAIVDTLYEKLPENGSELVVLDANRLGGLEEFMQPRHKLLLNRIMNEGSGKYAVSVVTNRTPEDQSMLELKQLAGVPGFTERPLDYAWPENVYSLTHVALPFPLDDQVYGLESAKVDGGFPHLGQVYMVGENGALILPPALLQRLRSNPFYGYIEERLGEAVDRVRAGD